MKKERFIIIFFMNVFLLPSCDGMEILKRVFKKLNLNNTTDRKVNEKSCEFNIENSSCYKLNQDIWILICNLLKGEELFFLCLTSHQLKDWTSNYLNLKKERFFNDLNLKKEKFIEAWDRHSFTQSFECGGYNEKSTPLHELIKESEDTSFLKEYLSKKVIPLEYFLGSNNVFKYSLTEGKHKIAQAIFELAYESYFEDMQKKDMFHSYLILIVKFKHKDILKYLKQKESTGWKKKSSFLTDRFGKYEGTILHLAITMNGDLDFITYIKNLKPEHIKSLDNQNASPFIRICEKIKEGKKELTPILDDLIDESIVNSHDSKKSYPLHYMALFGNEKLVKKLLSWGVGSSRKNDDRKTAWDLAETYELKEILRTRRKSMQ